VAVAAAFVGTSARLAFHGMLLMGMAVTPHGNGWRSSARIATAVLLLNGALAFENLWPTPAIVWRGGVSIEFVILLLTAVIALRRKERPPSRVLSVLSAAWVVLGIGRYLDVTAPALYGREVNLTFWRW
jgi:hypothetical protein